MASIQNELEQTIRDSLDRLLSERSKGRTRSKGDADCPWRNDLWRALARELGVLGVGLPESEGGLGGGHAEIGAVMELLGRHLIAEPFLPTVVMSARFLEDSGDPDAVALLADIVEGSLICAVAHAEADGGYDPAHVATRAVRGRDGFLVTGHKTLVLHAPCADRFIVIARTDGQASDRDGITTFLIRADAPGLQRRDYRTLDGAAASDITFSDTPAALLRQEGKALTAIEKILDEAVVAVCAEACGVLQKLVDLTVEYTRQRRQFGRAIAEFQVLQHRMVDMLIEVKQAGILTRMARAQLETPMRAAAVSAAKSRVGRACRLVSQAAVQLHGGVGIADETPVSQYFRRALMIEQQFGSTDFHLERYERLQLSACG